MKEILIDKASLTSFVKSAEKHTKTIDKLISKGDCAIGKDLADEFNRFEQSVQEFKRKNKLP